MNVLPGSAGRLVVFEDDHLLVVSKPAGIATHRPGPDAPGGLFELLRDRGGSWARLSLPHRLDKLTSGVLVLGKSRLANRSLFGQFAGHSVEKVYELLTRADGPTRRVLVEAAIHEPGARRRGASPSSTWFEPAERLEGLSLIVARPLTGRHHQIRRHAALSGWPVLGDRVHGPGGGDVPWPRLFLHARSITIRHPATGDVLALGCPRPRSFEAVMAGERDLDVVTRLVTYERDAALGL